MARESLHRLSNKEALNSLVFTDDLWASSGEMAGYDVIHKFGHNLDVNGAFETIWSVGNNYSYLSAATVLKISSSDVNDTSAGTGARTVFVQGLDSNYNQLEETVTLNGQTAVDTTNSFIRVFRMVVLTAGSGKKNDGIIYAGTGTITAGVPANKYASIPIGYNQTMMAVYTIPAKKTAYMTTFYCQPDSQASFQVQLLSGSAETGIMRVRNELHGFQNNAKFEYRPYLKIDEKVDLELRASVGTANTEFSGGFSIILVGNKG